MTNDIEAEIMELITEAEHRKAAMIAWLRETPTFTAAFANHQSEKPVADWYCVRLRELIAELEKLACVEAQP